MRRRGITLLELLFVIAVITILLAIAFPVFQHAREEARKAANKANTAPVSTNMPTKAVVNDTPVTPQIAESPGEQLGDLRLNAPTPGKNQTEDPEISVETSKNHVDGENDLPEMETEPEVDSDAPVTRVKVLQPIQGKMRGRWQVEWMSNGTVRVLDRSRKRVEAVVLMSTTDGGTPAPIKDLQGWLDNYAICLGEAGSLAVLNLDTGYKEEIGNGRVQAMALCPTDSAEFVISESQPGKDGLLHRDTLAIHSRRWSDSKLELGSVPSAESLAWSPDGGAIAAGCGDGMIRLWDRASLTAQGELRTGIKKPVTVSFSPGGSKIIGKTAGGTTFVWSRQTRHLIRKTTN